MLFWDAHWSGTWEGNGQCPASSVRILTLHCFAPSRLSPRGLTAATTAQPPLLMLQSRGQIPAATRHVRLWDAGKGHGNGVRADPALPRRSSAHMQLRGCGVASAGGWGVCPTDRCEADEGLISVSPLRYGGLQMQEQQRLPPNIGVVLPSPCHTVGRAAAALWYPMPPMPLWVGDTELKSHCSSALLQRAERTREHLCFIPHPLGFGSVSSLPGAMPRKGQPVASLHAGEGWLLRPHSTSPLPLLPTKQSKRAIKEQKGAPLHLTLQKSPRSHLPADPSNISGKRRCDRMQKQNCSRGEWSRESPRSRHGGSQFWH